MKSICILLRKVVEYSNEVWYYLFRVGKKKIRKSVGDIGDMKEVSILDAKVLANYIKKYYKDNVSEQELSPIKLQKSLYFCFAYWGGFVRKQKLGNNELNRDLPELLFNNKIEAWVYGPVVPDVYHCKNLEKYQVEKPFNDIFVQEFINGVLDDVLNSNDFKLVEVSHQDKCWKKNFKPKSKFHNSVIPFEEIISEYARNY